MHAHLQQVEQGAVYLAAGVTTVRDLGNILEFITGVRDAIDPGTGLGPRVLVSGIVDGEGPAAIGTMRIETRDDIRPVIARLSRGRLPRGEDLLEHGAGPGPADRRRGAPARPARHRSHPERHDVVEAIAAGFDGVNQSTSLFTSISPSAEMRKLSAGRAHEAGGSGGSRLAGGGKVIDLSARRKIVIDDTLVLYELLSTLRNRTARTSRAWPSCRPRCATVSIAPERPGGRRFLRQVAGAGRRPSPARRSLVAGTDIGVPGHSLHRELELYVRAGFTPMEAIQAATIVPARAMRLDKELGTVEPGKRADLVIVAGDPLVDIPAIRKVVRVITRGVPAPSNPAVLWRLADFKP